MGMTDIELEQHDKLNSIIKTLNNDKSGSIVLIGDIMLDCYIHGYANNLNSRAPVPVLRETHREEDVGAAAHVARGLQSMGYNGRIFGAVGDDKAGSKILDYLDGENVDTSGIAIIEDRITTVKTRMLASRESLVQGEQLLLRWDVEEDEPIPENALEAIYDQAIANLDNADCVILSDYGQGVIYDSGAERITEQAKNMNIPIIADPKLTGLHRTHEVDWIIFQSRGFELMKRRIGESDDTTAAQSLIQSYGWKHLVVLAGGNGVTIYSKEEDTVHAPCTLPQLRQVIGLIDAAVVAIAVSISNGFSVSDTTLLTNAACECILSAEATDSFSLSKDMLIHRVGEIAWNLQVSKR
ncbi:MAG: PfkB family carbohydrate kinase [Candidatus Thermoplasmatota archaeon]|nr:PfkB family carbohydrate kinase [Candidatus Thermoplasmatota archaeon]MEC7255782.1 PfkB family carbohydrate kinase [Candidatus Thermoplasmatota archaeon]MEC8242435.1 PfkB family carbohydrate kinase [Candidatus Thermoplasmatota archaeon]MEC8249165.1 PfkB family carbohydrate kinase [Candidatus Thermoplasmatota archaeon]MEC8312588.1 PfkB family carbohydrate kinase [Candidatus Thermoplasmatota archaeon]